MAEKGNTYIELLVVIAIFSVLAVGVIPKFTLKDNVNLDIEAAYLAAELRYLQELSCTIQQVHTEFPAVRADNSPRFVVEEHEYHIMHNGKMYHKHELPASLKIKSNRQTFFFTNGGMAQTVTIELAKGGSARYVIVDIVGRIRVSDVPPG